MARSDDVTRGKNTSNSQTARYKLPYRWVSDGPELWGLWRWDAVT